MKRLQHSQHVLNRGMAAEPKRASLHKKREKEARASLGFFSTSLVIDPDVAFAPTQRIVIAAQAAAATGRDNPRLEVRLRGRIPLRVVANRPGDGQFGFSRHPYACGPCGSRHKGFTLSA